MDNEAIEGIAAFGDLLNLGKIFMLLAAGTFLWLSNELLRRSSQRLMDFIPSRRFMILQLATLLTFIWYFAGAYWMLVGILQPPKEMLLALAGSAAVAMGFAFKDVAASIIAGLILLFDRPFQVGDRVSFGDTYGEIISIGLRSVRLNTLDDSLVTIPNSRFITDVVSSGNAGALDMMVVSDFHVALNADIEKVQALIHEVIVTSRFVYLKKPVIFAVEEVAIAERLAIRIRAKAYVLDVHYEKAFQADIVIRAAKLLCEHEVPRPTHDPEFKQNPDKIEQKKFS
ncbi:mechanosensitive ion channel [Ketobacter sp. MCCC 1A13808]|uniref:mechanosensitive ion channel family protein n=1 Tax=Ketobacter sp. MCCC 1A13808 TaxID=2602738 RepID=UPI000F18A0BC|nr:mechanosensitive ion channel domain-containing protein [Ketobacter sp. MCCC 1A13808]MVF11343.1 mechanosensitive ion channel [Ketobacter sp. MCCC 1A13808]RLP54714.1 MAG: mechanosensitive ion channel family protein [Ketobacter sp.]